MELCKITAEIPAMSADEVDGILLELGVPGWSVLEDALSKRAWLVGVFESEGERSDRWAELKVLLPEGVCEPPEFQTLADADWRDSYKAHFKAWRFGPLHWVPVWEREAFALPPGETVVWLDPGLAFGTGNHETTRLCVERLVGLAAATGARGSVIDAGCGSGILALSAAKLGYSDVSGFDNDPDAVRVSEENAVLNGLSGQVIFSNADLTSGLAGKQADVVLANILANVLVEFAGTLVAAVAPGGTLVLSGILAGECGMVQGAFIAAAPRWHLATRTLGEWSDVAMTRPLR